MQLTERIPFRAVRAARRRRAARVRPLADPPTPTLDQVRVGVPQDRATYNCSCGYVFEADVTTSICCPHCSGELAW